MDEWPALLKVGTTCGTHPRKQRRLSLRQWKTASRKHWRASDVGLFDERTGGLVTYWKSKAAITALVGTGTAARIWPSKAKQGADVPHIVYSRVGGESAAHLAGASGARKSVVHVYCYAETQSGADALAEAVRTSTANYRGDMSGTTVMWVECTDALDDGTDAAQDASDNDKYWVRVILRISHVEALGV